MNKGKRYKKQKNKTNISKVFWVIIFILTFIFGLINIFNNRKKEDLQISKSEDVENISVVSKEMMLKEVIEEIEDSEIKQLIEDLRVENNLNENNFAFFYYNIDTKKYYFYNESTYFKAASTIKMPISMLYYDKIREGEMSIDSTIVYTNDCYESGAGTTSSIYSVGSRVPISFLLEQSIVNSDNTAINILIKNLGYENCKSQISNYSDVQLPDEFLSSNITSASYAYDVVKYLYNNIENYGELIENLKISSNGLYLKKYIQNYEVAHKYGSYDGYIHDYGIVFGETTYLVGVFTKNVANADEFIAQVSLETLQKTLNY